MHVIDSIVIIQLNVRNFIRINIRMLKVHARIRTHARTRSYKHTLGTIIPVHLICVHTQSGVERFPANAMPSLQHPYIKKEALLADDNYEATLQVCVCTGNSYLPKRVPSVNYQKPGFAEGRSCEINLLLPWTLVFDTRHGI